MSVWAILPCRSQSERLYCKPLQRIGDRTILGHLIDNIRSLGIVDGIALAVAEGPANACFVEFAERRNLPVVVGSEQNVLARVLEAVKRLGVDTMFRMTTECPFIYADGAAGIAARHAQGGYDFSTIVGLPLGTTYELIQTRVLEEMHATGDARYQAALSRYIRERQDRFRIQTVQPAPECQRPELSFAVDHPGQLVFCRLAFDALRHHGLPVKVRNLVRYYDENPLPAALLDSIHEDPFAVRPDQTVARVWP